jgi:outer membrane protein assembly factor BamB
VNLSLEEALPDGVDRPRKEAARWILRRGGKAPKTLWKDKQNRRFTSFIVGPNRLVGAGHPDADLENPFLAAIDINDGSDVWNHSIPAHTVKGGTAIDSQGRIFAALENGRLLCFVPSK